MNRGLLVLITLTLVFMLFACSKEDTVYIDEFEFGYTTSEDVIANKLWNELETGESIYTGSDYWLVFRFSLYPEKKSSNDRYISASLSTTGMEILGGHYTTSFEGLDDASVNFSFDAGTSLDKFWDIKIDRVKERKTEAILVVKVTPTTSGESTWTFSIEQSSNSESSEISIQTAGSNKSFGPAPFQKTLSVKKTIIESPNLFYTPGNNYVDWEHVEFASGYEVYVNDVLFDTIDASTKQTGTSIRFYIDTLTEPYYVYVRALSPSTLFIDSFDSNTLYFD